MLLLVWCPGGYERPYACPKAPDLKNGEKIYYIRKLSSTIEATDMDVKELMSLSHNIPFDCHICCMGFYGWYLHIPCWIFLHTAGTRELPCLPGISLCFWGSLVMWHGFC